MLCLVAQVCGEKKAVGMQMQQALIPDDVQKMSLYLDETVVPKLEGLMKKFFPDGAMIDLDKFGDIANGALKQMDDATRDSVFDSIESVFEIFYDFLKKFPATHAARAKYHGKYNDLMRRYNKILNYFFSENYKKDYDYLTRLAMENIYDPVKRRKTIREQLGRLKYFWG